MGGGEGVWRWGKREIIHLSLHCHHQNDSCIKMGSDEGHFNVSLTARDEITRRCPQTTTFEEKGEPKRIRTQILPLTSLTNALPLGQTTAHTRNGRARFCLLPNTALAVSGHCMDTLMDIV